jgi:alkylation response protein AidB-like acyl-CoA dehydrogenase
MALVLTVEQSMLRDTARSFLGKNAPLSHLRQLRDRRDSDGFSRALWNQFAGQGWTGILVPEGYGGLSLGYVEAGIVMEELGHTLTPSPMLSTSVMAATAILRGGSDAQKSAHLPRIAGGDLIVALAVDETPKHRPEKVSLAATRSGGDFSLNGSKCFVVDGHVADLLIVAARTSGAPGETPGITLFVLDSRSKGLRVERTVTVDSHNAARVVFENVRASTQSVLGEIDHGWSILESALNAGRAALASELLGAGDEVFARTLAYLKERRQFGKFIGEFQALQHRSAQLYCELEVTRSAVLNALLTLDDSFDAATPMVAIAKARAGRSATLAAQEGIQMHGGIGMTDEFDIGFFLKRVRVCQELFGDENFHADLIARLGGY